MELDHIIKVVSTKFRWRLCRFLSFLPVLFVSSNYIRGASSTGTATGGSTSNEIIPHSLQAPYHKIAVSLHRPLH